VKKLIHLGYEIGTGRPVEIPLSHLIVTGVTQLSGKTTTLEALIERSEQTAIVFKTKPGETGFAGARVIAPYFKEQSDWQYVQSLLEATMRERMKFQRSWIITVCKGTSSLFQVKRNIDDQLANPKVTGLNRSIYTELEAYFKLILPQLSIISFSNSLDLEPGVNVMDLTRMSLELQSLVIRSVLETVLRSREKTIAVIPECWKFLSQTRGNPVKEAAESFIRQGATNGNYLWLDSQDVSSVDKIPLKSVSIWILGIQSERNEVQHTIDQMPLAKDKRPKVDEVMNLQVGRFYACTPQFTKLVYVQPSWIDTTRAELAARGQVDPASFKRPSIENAIRPALIPEPPPPRSDFDLDKYQAEIAGEFELMEKRIEEIATKLDAKIDSQISKLKTEILSSLPKNGSAVYQIEPLKMLQRKCLEEARDLITSQIAALTDDQKKILRYIESAQTGVKQKDLLDKCLGLSGTSGGNGVKVKALTVEMDSLSLIRRDDRIATSYPALLKRIESDLSPHSATPEEIKSVYDHVIASLVA